jgi:hypothetical protein
MDFRLYARVLWRFRLIVMLGLIIGLLLSVLSMARISSHGLTYRQAELWSSTTRLGVTQQGFPWGRLFATEPAAPGQEPPSAAEQAARLGIPIADPNRLNNLAVLYAELATSDPVRALMRRDGPIRGKIIATPLVVGDNRIMLPLIDVTAIASTRRGAYELALRSATALESYVRDQQRTNNVPDSDRVVIQEVQRPKGADVFQPRSKTMPIVVFLAVLLATVGLAFLLENLRPRTAQVSEPTTGVGFKGAEQRRTA